MQSSHQVFITGPDVTCMYGLNPKTDWKAVKHFIGVSRSSLPWCCALSWRGGLCALGTLRAMMAGDYAPGKFSYAGLLKGRRTRLNSTLVDQMNQ